ncbi:hypothetical protein HMSSN139_01410 [Paenibacillus sp. HMSSN-139]|nr:hypothetical protein HMSSN139_01410 [Paenibacillus sp. HMSSN-139]
MKFMVQDKAFYRSFFRLTWIITLQNVISFGVNLSDNIMLGGYSESALSGVALANQLQFLLQMLVMGVGEGVVILSSRAWGARDIKAIKKVASIGMRLALALALLLWLAVFLFPHGCLSLFTNEDNVIAEGAQYLRIIGFSYLFFAATNLLLASLRSVETVRVGFILSLSTLIINVCLNYLLIYGHFGFPAWGVRGSAAATLTARIIELAIVAGYLKRVDQKIKFALRDFFQFDRGTFKQYLSVGSPILMSNALWGLAMAVQSGDFGAYGGSGDCREQYRNDGVPNRVGRDVRLRQRDGRHHREDDRRRPSGENQALRPNAAGALFDHRFGDGSGALFDQGRGAGLLRDIP